MKQQFRTELESKSLSDIADIMYERWDNPAVQIAGQVEFLRRQTQAQQAACDTASETAVATKRNANYMLLSVIVLTVSCVISLLTTVLR
jgi:hypothetical protein